MSTSLIDRLDKEANRISRLTALVGLFGLLALASATVLDIFMRWIFNSPITGVRDAGELFTAVIIASCFALCISERNNITIRFIGNVLGPRVKDSFEAFGNLVTMIMFALMTWQLWIYANELAIDGETTWVLGWELSPWWRSVSVLIGLCVPVQAVVFLQTIRSAIAGVATGKIKLSSSNDKGGAD